MNLASYLILILLAAFLGGFVASKLKLPLAIGYLSSGIIVSFILKNATAAGTLVDNIAQIGVALLMFTLGLEFSFRKILNLGEIILLGSLVQILLTIIFGILFFNFLGFDFYNSLFLGCAFSLSSTAVIFKIYTDKGELESLHGEIAIGWLLVQDLATIFFIIILPRVGISITSGSGLLWNILSLFRGLALAFSIILILFIAGRKVVPFVINAVATLRSRELLLLAVISFCFLFALLTIYIGLPFSLGAFMAGIIISPVSGKHAIFSEVRPLRDIFAIIFFVSLGLLIKADFVWQNIGLILVISLVFIAFKFILSDIICLLFGYHTRTSFNVGISLVTIGEFAFILGTLGRSQKLITQESYMIILSVTLVTLLLSSSVLNKSDLIYLKLKKFLIKYLPWSGILFSHFDQKFLTNNDYYHDHVVILGHGRVGKYISKALFRSGIQFLVIDFNNHLVSNLKAAGVDVIYGDPSEIDVLKAANIEKAKVLIIAIPDRNTQDMIVVNALSLNPNLKIISRSHFEEDLKRLKTLGVNEVIQPEFEAALTITSKLLTMYDLTPDIIEYRINGLIKDHGF